MAVVIFHHPECGTSNRVLERLISEGLSPTVIDYQQSGWTDSQLLGLFAAADLTAHEALRVKNSPAEALGLNHGEVSETDLLSAMVAHPILVNRPIVCTPKGVRLCRPESRLDEIL